MEPTPGGESYSGARVVAVLAVALVGVAGLLGFLLGAVILPRRIGGPLPNAQFGPVTFPITPVTMALYGVLVVGVGFVAALALVRAVSDRYVEAE